MLRVLSKGKEANAFVRSMKHAPNLAKHTFTNAITSHSHKSLMGLTVSFVLSRWKKLKSPGVAGLSKVL